MSTNEDKKAELKNTVNNYQQTTKALLAFSSFVVHDGTAQRSDANFGIGRKMKTSNKNKISKMSEVTPDLVAQKSLEYGVIAEVKKSLPNKSEYWNRYLEQFAKYDDDLTGWWTTNEKITNFNCLLLIHQSRSRVFVDFVKAISATNPEIISKNTAIIEFNSSDETASYYFFRLEHGDIVDDDLKTSLYQGINIPLDKVLRTYPNIKYYDSEPPTLLILTDLWADVLPSKIPEGERDEESNRVKISISVQEITNELQKAYGSKNFVADSRAVEFPRPKWIKKALDELVRFKLAIPPTDGSSNYEIHYHAFKKDILERFVELCTENDKQSKKTPETQQKLFE